MNYTPDRWAILEIIPKDDETIHKVLAGWKGGYTGADSWQINSGIESVTMDEHKFVFHGYSGSEYHCYRNSYGTTMLSFHVFQDYAEKIEKAGRGTMKLLTEEEVIALYESRH